MMKMATGEGSPPPAGCQDGSRLVFGGPRGFWQWNSRSILLPEVFRVYGYIWEEEVRRWTSGLSTRQGGAPRGWARPPPSWAARDSPGPSPILRGLLLVQISSVNFQVNWTPFDFPFLRYSKTRKKQKLALGSGLIG